MVNFNNMILVWIAWFLLLADVIMTYFAIKRYGTGVETNPIMRAVMNVDYSLVTVLTIAYMIVILHFHNLDMIGLWSWVVILGLNGSIFISNTIWFVKYYKG